MEPRIRFQGNVEVIYTTVRRQVFGIDSRDYYVKTTSSPFFSCSSRKTHILLLSARVALSAHGLRDGSAARKDEGRPERPCSGCGPSMDVSATLMLGDKEVHSEEMRLELQSPVPRCDEDVREGSAEQRLRANGFVKQFGQQLSMKLRVRDAFHSCVNVHQITTKTGTDAGGHPPGLPSGSDSAAEQDEWCWDKPVLTLKTDDTVCWHWTRGPLKIVATDRQFRTLPPVHVRAFSSGPAADKGVFEWRFHFPGTYYYGCTSRDNNDALTCRGKILVQSEWQMFITQVIRKERQLVCASLCLWVILAIALEVFRHFVFIPAYQEAARQLPPLTSVVTQLLPAALSWVIPPATLSLVLLTVAPVVWLVHSFRKHHLTAFGRGYVRRVHRQMRVVIAVCVLFLTVLILLGWLLSISFCDCIGELTSGLSKAVLDNVDHFRNVMMDGDLLLNTFQQEGAFSDSFLHLLVKHGIDASQVLSDGSVLTDGMQLLAAEATDLCMVLQQAFLAVNFLFLLLASLTAAQGASASISGSASQARAMGWLATWTLTIFFLIVSINGAATVTIAGLPSHLRLHAEASAHTTALQMGVDAQVLPLLSQLYDYCGAGAWTEDGRPNVNGTIQGEQLDVVFNAAGALAQELNALLGKQIVFVEESPEQRSDITFERVHILLESISWELIFLRNHANISEVVSLAAMQGVPALAGVDAEKGEGVISVLYVTLSMLQKLITFLQCETVAPHLANVIERYERLVSVMWELQALNLAFSVVLALLIALSGIGAHVFERPSKHFYHVHSGRWFRFLPSYRAHKTCWKRIHDAVEGAQRRLAESTSASGRKVAMDEASKLERRSKRNLYYHPPRLSCGDVLEGISNVYSTLLLWLLLFTSMVLSLLMFGYRDHSKWVAAGRKGEGQHPELCRVESAMFVGFLSPFCGILAIEISQILKQTMNLRRVQTVLGYLTALGTCATCVLLLLSFFAFQSQAKSKWQICDDATNALLLVMDRRRQAESGDSGMKSPARFAADLMRDCGKNELSELIFWTAVCALGALMAALACLSGLVYISLPQRESGGSYGREAALLASHVETGGDMRREHEGVDSVSGGEGEGFEMEKVQGNGQGGDKNGNEEDYKGDSSSTFDVDEIGVSGRRAADKEESGILPQRACAQTKEEEQHKQEVTPQIESSLTQSDLGASIECQIALPVRNTEIAEGETMSTTDVSLSMGTLPLIDNGDRSGERGSGLPLEIEVEGAEREGAEKRSGLGMETYSGIRSDGDEGSMAKEKLDEGQGNKTEKKGRVWRRRMCVVLLAFVVVCVSCVLAVRLAWGRRDREGVSNTVAWQCNGAEHLCHISYDKVTYGTVHNAYSSLDDGFSIPNNFRSFDAALEQGVRALMLDLVSSIAGGARLCHVECALGMLELGEGLRRIHTFLRLHEHEVVTIILENMPLDGDRILEQQLEEQLRITELISLLFVPTPSEMGSGSSSIRWPTLGEMIKRGQRLVIMSDRRGIDGLLPWYLYMWDVAVETPYSFFVQSDLERIEEDQNVESGGVQVVADSCRYNRGSQDNTLYIVNHFVTNPVANAFLAETINYDSLLRRALACAELKNRTVNFLTVDFWSASDLMAAVAMLNSIPS